MGQDHKIESKKGGEIGMVKCLEVRENLQGNPESISPQLVETQSIGELRSTDCSTSDTASLMAVPMAGKAGDAMCQAPVLAEATERV